MKPAATIDAGVSGEFGMGDRKKTSNAREAVGIFFDISHLHAAIDELESSRILEGA